MSGHSKWASIKHKKAITDSRRGKQFSKLTRAIMVAARDGGGDPIGNPALELAIRKAQILQGPQRRGGAGAGVIGQGVAEQRVFGAAQKGAQSGVDLGEATRAIGQPKA